MSKIQIEVISPFGLRLGSQAEKREFAKGGHAISREEYAHWYMQAQIKEKNVLILADRAEAEGPDDGDGDILTHSKESLVAMKQDELKALARSLGLEFKDSLTKAQVAELILDGAKSVSLVNRADGGYSIRAAETE